MVARLRKHRMSRRSEAPSCGRRRGWARHELNSRTDGGRPSVEIERHRGRAPDDVAVEPALFVSRTAATQVATTTPSWRVSPNAISTPLSSDSASTWCVQAGVPRRACSRPTRRARRRSPGRRPSGVENKIEKRRSSPSMAAQRAAASGPSTELVEAVQEAGHRGTVSRLSSDFKSGLVRLRGARYESAAVDSAYGICRFAYGELCSKSDVGSGIARPRRGHPSARERGTCGPWSLLSGRQ